MKEPSVGREQLVLELAQARRRIAELEAAREQKAAAALKESEARFATIFKAAPAAIGILHHRIFHRVNSLMLAMTGYTEGELLGQSARMLYETEDEFQRVGRVKYAQIRERGMGEIDTRWRCKDGSVKEIHLRSAAVDPAGLSAGVIFTAIDITARRQAELELQAAYDELEARIARRTAELAAANEALKVQIAERERAMAAVEASEEKLQREQHNLRCLLEIYERDRQLAAFDIHDGVTQSLAAALMQLERGVLDLQAARPGEVPDGLTQALRLMRESLKEARRLMGGLRPAILDELGLRPAINHLVCEGRETFGGEIEYVEDAAFDRLAPPLETAVFRLVQEALANALRHSQSPKVRIRLTQRDDRLIVEVEDWGVGFDPARVSANRYGLEGIRLRAEMFGGEAHIYTAAGTGTRVEVVLPIVAADG